MLKCKYIFQIKYTEAILSNWTRKVLWLEIRKILNALKNEFIVLFIIIFSTPSFAIFIQSCCPWVLVSMLQKVSCWHHCIYPFVGVATISEWGGPVHRQSSRLIQLSDKDSFFVLHFANCHAKIWRNCLSLAARVVGLLYSHNFTLNKNVSVDRRQPPSVESRPLGQVGPWPDL